MDRNDSFRLADELIVAIDPNAAQALRPVLAEAFEGIEPPDATLIARGDGGLLKAYALYPSSLLIVDVQNTTAPGVRVDRVHLADAKITRQSHDLKQMHDGVWWDTTWRVECGDVSEVFTGREGPPHYVDQVAAFGRAVAKAAGWPIAV